MISLPSDFTAAPVLPTSGIAPKELIGNAKFPQLLGEFQAGGVRPTSETGDELVTASLIPEQPPAPQLSGNSLPQLGTALPLNQDLALNSGERSGEATDETLSEADRAGFGLSSPSTVLVEPRVASSAIPLTEIEATKGEGIRSSERLLAVHPATSQEAEEFIGALSEPALRPIRFARSDESALGAPTSARDTPRDVGKAPRNEPQVGRIRSAESDAVSIEIASQADVLAKAGQPPEASSPKTLATSSTNKSAPSPDEPAQLVDKPAEAEPPATRSLIAAGQVVQATLQTSRIAQAQALPNRSLPVNDLRAATGIPETRATKVPNMDEVDIDSGMPRVSLPTATSNGASPAFTTQSTPLTPAETVAPQTPVPQPQVAAVPTVQPNGPAPITDTGAALRATPQLESAIEQLVETRSASQANKPELTVRHQEFGAITMRLETTAGDLRATLSARDPGFVPAIQAALAERSITAASEAASGNSSRGNEQSGSNPNSQTGQQSGGSSASHGHAQGWGFGAAYGSSTGSGQGTPQPYSGQTEGQDEESGSDLGNEGMGRGTNWRDGPEAEGEIFA